MKRALFILQTALAALAILLIPALSVRTTAHAQDATVLIYSDPRPGQSATGGEVELTEDFDQGAAQMSSGWTLDCVQNSGDIDPISTGALTLDNAYAASELVTVYNLPHFMCVGNHEAETVQDMIDIRAKFSGYPDLNLAAGPDGTSETTYSYDVGHIHVTVLNQYWNGLGGGSADDHYFQYGGGNGGYIPDALFEWIKDDLRASTQPCKIVVGHESGYPVGRHEGDSLDQDEDNRDKFFNLLRTERVAAYFSAHTHKYDLTEHNGIFEVNTGVCGAYVGSAPNPGETDNDNFATLAYAHYDGGGFQVRAVREDPSIGWVSPRVTTKTRSDLETRILVNTAEGAGTLCRYFVDYTAGIAPDNPDWSAYGPWWESGFDDTVAAWGNGELGTGYDSTNPAAWGWINETIDPDPLVSGGSQVYGVFLRIPFVADDIASYPFMELGVDYDDAVTVWLNGAKIYESPTSPVISPTDYWDKSATGVHDANGDEDLNPEFDTIDVSAYTSSLNEGENILVIGNWNREPGSSDLIAGVRLRLYRGVPAASTRVVDSVTCSSVTLNGRVNPRGLSATYYFEYGTTTSYGSTTTGTSAGSGTDDLPVSADITGLSEDTTYHCRLVAVNANGTTYGDDVAFTTPPCQPSCPDIYSWNGEEWKNNGFIFAQSHCPESESYQTRVITRPVATDGDVLVFKVSELNGEISYINSLAIYCKNGEENSNAWIKLHLLSAIHNRSGDVSETLERRDDARVNTVPGDEILLTYAIPPRYREGYQFKCVSSGYYLWTAETWCEVLGLGPELMVHPGDTVTLTARINNMSTHALPENAMVWFNIRGPGFLAPRGLSVSASGLAPGRPQWYSCEWQAPRYAQSGIYSYDVSISTGDLDITWRVSTHLKGISYNRPYRSTVSPPQNRVSTPSLWEIYEPGPPFPEEAEPTVFLRETCPFDSR